jgi:hypothetical protein
MFTFRHLVISRVSWFSCLCLELVPQVILLASISRPGTLALSSEFQWSDHSLQASSPLKGKVHRYLEFGPLSWLKIKAQNRIVPEAVLLRPVTEAVSFCSLHSHLHRLVSEVSGNQDGSPRCSCKALPGRVDTYPLARNVPGCLEPEKGTGSEALWLLPVLESVSFCCPHYHLCRLLSAESWNQDFSCWCSGKALLGQVDTYSLAGKVPGCLYFVF